MAGLSLVQAATLFGLTVTRLKRFEDGELEFTSPSILPKLAKAYDVSIRWLEGQNPPLPSKLENAISKLPEDDADNLRTLLQSSPRK
jgi:transcriptional regulator with XRE-family HTH domain